MGGFILRRELELSRTTKYVLRPLCLPSHLQNVDAIYFQSSQAVASVEGGLRSPKGM